MIVDLLKIEPMPFKFSVEIQPETIALEEEAAILIGPAKISGAIMKTDVRYKIDGKIGFQIEIDCTRCLQPISTKQELDFSAAYVSPEDYSNSVETELKEDDLEVAIFEDNKIDLAELAREQILLSLPTRFLCKEDCKGLCSKCGINKNIESCSCENKEIDPRWEVLKKFKE